MDQPTLRRYESTALKKNSNNARPLSLRGHAEHDSNPGKSGTMKRASNAFLIGNQTPKEGVGEGITRQLFGYDDSILMARVEFEGGAIGAVHSHPHSQVSYVESGEFDVVIDGVETRLGPGDSFYVHPHLEHGSLCVKAGVVLDVFSPVRDDFLGEEEA